MSDKIKAALADLDPSNDAHWTSDGLPRLDVMKELTGANVTREALNQVAKGFSRDNPNLPDESPGEGDTPWAAGGDNDETKPAEVEKAEEDESDQEASDRAAKVEYNEAKQEVEKAQRRLKRATAEYDKVLARKDAEEKEGGGMSDIQRFQKAQAAERAGTVAKQARLKEMLKGMDL